MKPFIWKEQLSVNIDVIDKDHQQLFSVIESYRLAVESGRQHALIEQLFSRLLHYVRTHFQREEAVFRHINYPRHKEHQQAHAFLSNEVERFKQLYDELPSLFPHEAMLAFLNEWLITHISTFDRHYHEHLERHKEQVTSFLAQYEPKTDFTQTKLVNQALSKPQLLVLDDDYSIGKLVATIADASGFESRAFQQAELFNKAYSNEIDVIVLDLLMPDIDGIEVIRYLSKHQCKAALILISGFDVSVLHSAQELALEKKLNLAGCLNKPFRTAALQQLLAPLAEKKIKHKNIQPVIKKHFTKAEIRHALDDEQFTAYYQPQFSLHDQELAGAEILCRWAHPEYGLISPSNFIRAAEEFQLIGELTWVMLKQAMLENKRWQKSGINMQLSINMSANMFSALDLPEKMHALVSTYDFPPHNLVLEVTESILMDQQINSLDSLTRLRLKGFKISIDDFGTGYSSMLQLHRIPFSEIKVDQSFIIKMLRDKEAHTIAETIIMLGHKLGLTVVAEGIENKETFTQLKSLNCEVGQGFHFAKPLSPENFYTWLQKTTTVANARQQTS